ncbi:homoserine dehydrogenase [Flavobacterium sp. CS20]|uniref:homoserine dehydrogenase n=1 Tax=Flavobacterium sp. CS20 TaxID=2775246 RepID=UPI001B39D14C|nr:homoserine dehydrogenase [Flavobacterium sp. CS20]QTY27822.1 homoserine dehydrogenase [Flavobacterium sp. CS20]
MDTKINIGMFGYGSVGQGFYKALKSSPQLDAQIKNIVVKSKHKKRDIAEEHFSFHAEDILENSDIKIVVELIDDANAAYKIVKTALRSGKHVVSANKKMIAHHLEELITISRQNNTSFLYEASVCASIPIIRNLEDYFKSDKIKGFQGICNGTTNYVLSRTGQGLSYKEALQEAQKLGFAESDPTLDVDGFDAKFKLGILIKHAFGIYVTLDKIFNCGIRHIRSEHVEFAKQFNYKFKLFSFAQHIEDKVIGFVAPFLVDQQHPNFNVENEFNAINIDSKFAHQQFFYGKGAGSEPTASAVLSDFSALLNQYKYSYTKTQIQNFSFTTNFYLKIYLASPNFKTLNQIPFQKTEQIHQSKNYSYKIGWLNFESIAGIDFNKNLDLFFAVYQEPFKLSLED